MVKDKYIHVQIYSDCEGYEIQVLNADGDRVLFYMYWDHNDGSQGVGGEGIFAELLKFLGYTVHHEES